MMRVVYVLVGWKKVNKILGMPKVWMGLGLGGQSPDALTITEHLAALSDGSSRPIAPSGPAPGA